MGQSCVQQVGTGKGGWGVDIVLSVVTPEICQNGTEPVPREEMTVLGLICMVTPLSN